MTNIGGSASNTWFSLKSVHQRLTVGPILGQWTNEKLSHDHIAPYQFLLSALAMLSQSKVKVKQRIHVGLRAGLHTARFSAMDLILLGPPHHTI